MTDVDAERSIACRVSPDEHPVRIAFIFGDVCLQPLDHLRNVFAAVVPILSGMPLHRDRDHIALHCPSADVVIERVGFPVLLFDLVASAARHVNQNRAVPAAFV